MATMTTKQKQADVELLMGDVASQSEDPAPSSTPVAGRGWLGGNVVAGAVIGAVVVCALATTAYKMGVYKVAPAMVSAQGVAEEETTAPDVAQEGLAVSAQGVAQEGPALSEHAADCLKLVLSFAEQSKKRQKAHGAIRNPKDLDASVDNKKAEGEISADSWKTDPVAVFEALEHYEKSMSPEQAEVAGCVLTDTVLQEIMGLHETPERAPGSKSVGNRTVQGDMVGRNDAEVQALQDAAAIGKNWAGNLWEDQRNIRYCFGATVTAEARRVVQEAVQHFENMIPCLGFKEVGVKSDKRRKCKEEPAIYIQSKNRGCWAYIGAPSYYYDDRSYGPSAMNLGPGCWSMGTAAHELGHSLGMAHEQSRTDTPKYVTIFWDNIRPGAVNQYEFMEDADRSMPYDLLSLMHYGNTDFGKTKNGETMKTMEAVGGPVNVMGNRMGLTLQDSKQVGAMYGCLDQIEHFKICTPDPTQCTLEDCGCHQNQTSNSEILKTTDEKGCHRCQEKCPDYTGEDPGNCGCSAGETRSSAQYYGKTYYYCDSSYTSGSTLAPASPRPGPSPSPKPSPSPSPNPSPSPSPSP